MEGAGPQVEIGENGLEGFPAESRCVPLASREFSTLRSAFNLLSLSFSFFGLSPSNLTNTNKFIYLGFFSELTNV